MVNHFRKHLFTLALVILLFAQITLTLNDNSTGPGLAWPMGTSVPMSGFSGRGSSISSYYTWQAGPVIPKSNSSLFQVPFAYIPMLWGCNSTYTQPFTQSLKRNFSNVRLTTQKEILGFNEPEQSGQANCSPEEAATCWKTYIEPLKEKGYRVGSPAVTSGDLGKEWMISWFQACDGGCNPDFLAVHWYDLGSQSFIQHLKDCYYTWGIPIWVTEYAPQNMDPATATTQATLSEIEQFMRITNEYMTSVDWVERWFWFGAMYDMNGVNPLDSLLDPSGGKEKTGALSKLGVQYAGANGSVSSTSTTMQADQSYGIKRLPLFTDGYMKSFGVSLVFVFVFVLVSSLSS